MIRKKRSAPRFARTGKRTTRSAKFKISKDEVIDYKNVSLLQKFLTDRGKIITRRVTGLTAKQQRQLSNSMKRARFLGLL